jgi:tRNA nucleotidyltransferase (CCA-adding enzyme)
LLEFLIELDAIRQPQRFRDFLKACEADSRGRTGYDTCATPAAELMLKAQAAAAAVDAGAIAANCESPEQIRIKVFESRLQAIQAARLN